MLLHSVWRRTHLPGIAALALGACLLTPAAASARVRPAVESAVSEEAAAGALAETTSGSPEGAESPREARAKARRQAREEKRQARSERAEERREAHAQAGSTRRAARADAGCTIRLRAPHLASAGAPLAIYGTLSCAEGESAAEQTVALYGRLVHTSGFTLAATATTQAGGAFELPTTLEGDSVFYARAGAARSARTLVKAAPTVVLTAPAAGTPLLVAGARRASSAAAPAAGAVTFTGTLSPAGAGANVQLQRQLRGGGWMRIAFGHVQAGGAFSIAHTFSRPGEVTLRALVRSHGRFVTSASAPVTYLLTRRLGAPVASKPSSLVTPAPAPASATAGEALTFTGTVAPAEGQTVDLERESVSGVHGYHVIASATVSPSGSYAIAHTFTAIGPALLRIGVPADAALLAGASEPFELEVTPGA